MMVSFIPCYKKSDPIAQAIRIAAAMLLIVLLLISFTAKAESIKLEFVEIDAVDGGYQFNADIEIMLNPTLKRRSKKVLHFIL